MEKFGVVLDDEKVKTGSAKGSCPKCGRELPKDQPSYCNNCGTEPFEKRPLRRW